MIILTGGAGFIGCNVLRELNDRGFEDILIVDEIGDSPKWQNLIGCKFTDYMPRSLLNYNKTKSHDIEAIIHLGACSDTLITNLDKHSIDNTLNSAMFWDFCAEMKIPFIYASSAAVYGNTSNFSESNEKITPLNPYSISKWLFDRQVLWAKDSPPKWYGLRFFNVYGAYERHKGKSASLPHRWIMTAYQRKERDDYGIEIYKHAGKEIKRDLVYVGDVARAVVNFFERAISEHDDGVESGIYNIGTGHAITLEEAAAAVDALLSEKLDTKAVISHHDMPSELIPRYQWFTEADITKLKSAMNIRMKGIKQGVEATFRDMIKSGEITEG